MISARDGAPAHRNYPPCLHMHLVLVAACLEWEWAEAEKSPIGRRTRTQIPACEPQLRPACSDIIHAFEEQGQDQLSAQTYTRFRSATSVIARGYRSRPTKCNLSHCAMLTRDPSRAPGGHVLATRCGLRDDVDACCDAEGLGVGSGRIEASLW
ncbi:hypothetical protein K439DRAFT_1612901 [Ramaria rubella]|nr:hypothetical protein K439DRAFT_1612901 [Ramaria rubella]